MNILVLSKDRNLRRALRRYFENKEISVTEFSTWNPSLSELFRKIKPSVVVVDSMNDGKNGEIPPDEILASVQFKVPTIIYSNCVDPVKFYLKLQPQGFADELVLKSEGVDELIEKIESVLRDITHEGDARPPISRLYDSLYAEPPFLVVYSPIMKSQIERAACLAREKNLPIIIVGDTGTGKELLARFVHAMSTPQGPFVAVNCADFKGVDLNIARSELFGHVRGAFTGAVKDRKGAFERASGGTLFLDEIEELPLPVQADLLRALQEKTIIPLGAEREIRVDVRVISATNRKLDELLNGGMLRDDLYFRLAGVIELPPLKVRGPTEILLLTEHFLRKYRPDSYVGFSNEFADALCSYDWPGNVRELEQTILHALSLAGPKSMLTVKHLPEKKFSVKSIREHTKELILERVREIAHSIDISTLSCDDIIELKEEFEALLMEPVFLKCGMNFSKLARELKTTRDLRKRKSGEILKEKYILKRNKFPDKE